MPGSQPGMPAAAVVGADGAVTYVNPATSPAYANLPAGSPGALMLQGPQAPAPAPAAVRQVITLPPVPGQPGRLVKLAGGQLAVTPSGLQAGPLTAPAPILKPDTDPPLGSQLIQSLPDGSLSVLPRSTINDPGDDGEIINLALLQAGGPNPGGIGHTNAGVATPYASGGIVRLFPMAYNIKTTIVMPFPGGSLYGHGNQTVLNYSGAGECIQVFNPLGPYTYTRLGNELQGFIVDGTAAAAGAIGVSLAGNQHDRIWLAIRNFTTDGTSVGLRIANDGAGTALNQVYGDVRLENNDNNVVFTLTSSDQAIEHIYVNFSINLTLPSQNGFVLQNNGGGINVQGSFIRADVRSNYAASGPATGSAIVFGKGCFFTETTFQFKNELTAGSGTAPQTIQFPAGQNAGFRDCSGILYFGNSLTPCNATAVHTIQWGGGVLSEPVLVTLVQLPQENNVYGGTMTLTTVTTPALPGSGSPVTNNSGVAVFVNFIGGTLTGVTVGPSGGHVAMGTAGAYVVPPGYGITPSWSSAPSGWVWSPIT